MKKILIGLVILGVSFLTGCSKIETGEVGLVVDYNGVIQGTPVGPGLHPTIFNHILVFSGKEVLSQLPKQTPQTADNLAMSDVEVRFAYSINPDHLMDLYTKYSTSYNLTDKDSGETQAMLGFVEKLVASAVNDSVQKYKALEVNGHRGDIATAIENDVKAHLIAEGLLVPNDSKATKVNFGQVVIAQAVPPASILASTQAYVDAQNALRTTQTQAEQARQKAQGAADSQVIAAKGEAESNVITAKGDAEAIKAKTAAIQSAGGADYLTLQAIDKWNGALPEAYYAGGPVPFVGGAIKGK